MAHPSQESSFGDVPLHKYERLKQENIDLGCKLMESEERTKTYMEISDQLDKRCSQLRDELEVAEAEIKRLREGLDGLAKHIWG